MAVTFRVQVQTAAQTVLEQEVVSLQVPGSEGFLGVLAHHAPLITALSPGPLTLRDAHGREEVLFLSGGFLEVADNRAIILADAVERPEEIDRARAEAARDRARRRLQDRPPHLDAARAEAALQRALSRIQVAERFGGDA